MYNVNMHIPKRLLDDNNDCTAKNEPIYSLEAILASASHFFPKLCVHNRKPTFRKCFN